MAISLYFGLPGCGKTTWLTKLAVDAVRKGKYQNVYRDLEILMDYAKNYKKIEKDFEALQKRVTALHGLYADVLDQLNKVYQFL